MSEVRSITCRQARRLLHSRLSGSLSPIQEARLEAHWKRCTACAEEARHLEMALRLLHSAPAPEPPPALAVRIRAAAADALRTGYAPRVRLAPAYALAGLAAVLLAALFTARLLPLAGSTPSAPASALAARPSAEAFAELPSDRPGTVVPAREAAPAPPMVVAVAAPPTPARPRRSVADPGARPVPPPASPAAPVAPPPQMAYVAARTAVADTASVRPRVSMEAPTSGTRIASLRSGPGTNVVRNSSDFADEVVGGLIAEVVLSNYLEGAPAGVNVTPAVLNTGAGG